MELARVSSPQVEEGKRASLPPSWGERFLGGEMPPRGNLILGSMAEQGGMAELGERSRLEQTRAARNVRGAVLVGVQGRVIIAS